MKQKPILTSVLALVLATAAFAAQANDKEARLLGEPVPVTPTTPVTRVIIITANTAYVNVTYGDIVQFVIDNKPFVWDFDGNRAVNDMDLAKIAPAGMVKQPVRVYIARNKHNDYGA